MITAFDIISRLTFPLITDTLRLSSRSVFIIGVLGIGAARVLLLTEQIKDYTMLLVLFAFLGMARALTVVNHVLIICDFAKEWCPSRLPGALGVSVVVKAVLVSMFTASFNGLKNSSDAWSLSTNLYLHILCFAIVLAIWSLLEPRWCNRNRN